MNRRAAILLRLSSPRWWSRSRCVWSPFPGWPHASARPSTSLAGPDEAGPIAVLDADDALRLRAARIVMRRWPFGAQGPCLRQALVAGRMVRHRRPRIAFGATRDAHGTRAHAWLLVEGVALDPDAARWTPLLRPGAA